MNLNPLKCCPLFSSVNPEEISAMLACLSATSKKHRKNEMIILAEEPVDKIGVLLSGSARVIKEDALGNRAIVTDLLPGDLFAEAIVCAGEVASPVTVEATSNAEVLYLDFHKIIHICSHSCHFHTKLIENMIRILAKKNVYLNQKIDYLSMRTTRGKLMEYLAVQHRQNKTNPFHIPFNRNELADFLAVDRSAMSRELSKMREEGLIDYQKNLFTIKSEFTEKL